MAKEYLNPVAEAEQGIAEFIASIPEVSAVFSGKQVPVFAATTEEFRNAVTRKIAQGVRQVIVVAFSRTTEVARSGAGIVAKAEFTVSVSSPGVLAESAIRATSDLAFAIVNALDGTVFSTPFLPRAVNFLNWELDADESGNKYAQMLSFEAFLTLKN